MTMALHVGLTARDAVHAALLAERGFGADPAALHGKYGFFSVFANQNPPLLPLGEPFELLASGIIFKPWPSGAPTHAAVDAALALRKRIGGDVARIRRVTCLVHPWNAMTLREEEPRDALQGKVNLRYCVAAALRDGDLTYRHFSAEGIADAGLAALRRLIDVRIAEDLPDNNEFPAEVRLELADGEVLAERREVPPGGSSRPLTQEEVLAKLRSCAAVVLDAAATDRIIDKVQRLEKLAEIESLCADMEGR
jgi:2-methylcitrate dehydratase PrpD